MSWWHVSVCLHWVSVRFHLPFPHKCKCKQPTEHKEVIISCFFPLSCVLSLWVGLDCREKIAFHFNHPDDLKVPSKSVPLQLTGRNYSVTCPAVKDQQLPSLLISKTSSANQIVVRHYVPFSDHPFKYSVWRLAFEKSLSLFPQSKNYVVTFQQTQTHMVPCG